MYNFSRFTDNNRMNYSILFLILVIVVMILPIHISNLLVVDMQSKLIYFKVKLYKFITLKSDKIDFNSISHLKINDEDGQIEFVNIRKSFFNALKRIKLLKVLSFVDVGTQSNLSLYGAIAYTTIISNVLVCVKGVNAGAQIKNYVFFNENKRKTNVCLYSKGFVLLIDVAILLVEVFVEIFNEKKRENIYGK